MHKNSILLCFIVLTAKLIMVLSEEDPVTYQSKFPDIFYMDDYYECSKHENTSYCTANMNLIPKDGKSAFWKEIKDWSVSRLHYDRSVIHRTLCIPSKYQDYDEKKGFFERTANKELKPYNLSTVMFSMDCKKDDFGTDIKVILIGLIIYLGLTLLCTIYDHTCDVRSKQSIIGKWLTCFSVTSNWQKLTSDKNADFQRLKCIQGIRTYQNIIVITCHVLLANIQLYIKNTTYVEEIYADPMLRVIVMWFMFVIQVYFVLSSWLMTNQILGLYDKNGRFSVRDGLVLLLHRVTRFWAPMLSMMFIGMRLFTYFGIGPGNFEMGNHFSRTCSKNWWATFLLVTNFIDPCEVCNLGMWSLSLDTQFYFVSIVFLYLTLNYRLNIKKYLAFMFIFAYIVNVVVFYREEFPLLSWNDLKTTKRIDFYNYNSLEYCYFGFWINIGSSLVGILFGYFYFHSKEDTKSETFENLYGLIFAVIPIVTVLFCLLEPGRLVSAFIGPLLKPLYGFGIATGIYGMSRNVIQGWPKSICENKYAVLLGNFNFSTYIFHFLVVFTVGAKSTSLVEFTMKGMVKSSLVSIIQSLAVGMVCALVIEQPGINIKKILLPQIRRKEESPKEQYNNSHKEN